MAAVSRSLAVVAALACARPAASAPSDSGMAGRADSAASVAVAGLPPLPAWRALFEAARRRHVLWGDGAFPAPVDEGSPGLAGFDGTPPATAEPASPVAPLLAPPALVREALESAPADDGALGAAVLESRRAALVYRGLAGVDEPTVAALAASPGLTKSIGDCCADAFAAFGGRMRVRDGRVVVPGSAEAWEALVGEPVASPSAFLPALLAARGGRRAHLYDTLARLEPARLRFAIGTDAPAQVAGLRALAGVFDAEPAWWGREARGYGRDAGEGAEARHLRGRIRSDREPQARGLEAGERVVEVGPPPPRAARSAGRNADGDATGSPTSASQASADPGTATRPSRTRIRPPKAANASPQQSPILFVRPGLAASAATVGASIEASPR